MEKRIEFKDVNVGDYIKAVIVSKKENLANFDTTYFKVENIEKKGRNNNIDIQTTLWVDFYKGKFTALERSELGRTSLSSDWKDTKGNPFILYRMAEEEFFKLFGKLIIIESLTKNGT